MWSLHAQAPGGGPAAGPARRRRCATGCARFRSSVAAEAPARLWRSCRTAAATSGSACRSVSRAAPTRSIRTAPLSRACPLAACRCSTCASRRSAARSPPDARLTASIFTDSFTYPSVNVIAKVPGRDPKLRDEYVLFSAHQDHDGARYPVNGDSIWNGADDNATTVSGAAGHRRARCATSPGRRSALFVWHGAEERGLLGSRWYVGHPTVPLTSDRRGAQRRHDRPQPSGHARRCSARSRRIATRPRSSRWRSRANNGRLAVHARHVLGRPDASRRLVLPQRSPAVRAQRTCRR